MMNCDCAGNEGAKKSLRKHSTDGGALFGWMIARITPKGKIKFMMKSHAKYAVTQICTQKMAQ
eukprot:2001529-Karenia_brevis.AAC.1